MSDSIAQDLARIRAVLAKPGVINFQCFNNEEAEEIDQKLTAEERERVAFSWDFTTKKQTTVRRRRFTAWPEATGAERP